MTRIDVSSDAGITPAIEQLLAGDVNEVGFANSYVLGQTAIDLLVKSSDGPIQGVTFAGAKFGGGDVSFSRVSFGDGGVDFSRARFGDGHVDFSHASFGEGHVSFSGADFGEGEVDFSKAVFGQGNLDFGGSLSQGIHLGDMVWTGRGTITADIQGANGTPFSLLGAEFRADCVLLAGRGLHIDLGGAAVRAPLSVVAVNLDTGDQSVALPALESVVGADITELFRIGRNIDLKSTVWGDHDLSRIELASTDSLGIGAGGRRTLHHPAGTVPGVIERNYRDLRRALETNSDHDTASDFFYGEMDARLKGANKVSAEAWL